LRPRVDAENGGEDGEQPDNKPLLETERNELVNH
jgi:hypothetical protein